MKYKSKPFDVVDYLKSEEDIFCYLQAVIDERDFKALLKAIDNVQKAITKSHRQT
ncbi:helix-turn-helix domain-containing transcriptional regulator, partial [Providencia manganoxydans]|uniref:helix-turn-helix domain-containing transcriptional regulator n=1 Tax=Providencia manganoxydans TaxID=2923283 RepID=UPI0034E3D505